MKTFIELAECLARIPPKITLYGRLFKYNYVGCLLLLMFSSDLLFAIKRDAYIFKERGWFYRFPKRQKLDKWTMAKEKRQTCWPKLHTETEYESQITTILLNRNDVYKHHIWDKTVLCGTVFIIQTRTECSISQFCKTNCTHSIFRTIEARVGF